MSIRQVASEAVAVARLVGPRWRPPGFGSERLGLEITVVGCYCGEEGASARRSREARRGLIHIGRRRDEFGHNAIIGTRAVTV